MRVGRGNGVGVFAESGRAALGACARVCVRAELSGGRGGAAWQHAQLCRAALGRSLGALAFSATCL